MMKIFARYMILIMMGWNVIGSTPLSAQNYQPWPGNQDRTQINNMIEELRRLITQAERDRAADPNFLQDLKRLAEKYQAQAQNGNNSNNNSSNQNIGRVFYDDFADGEFYANPSWKISAGSWSVDRSGQNIGLVSKIGRPLSANNILGALLAPQGSQQQNQYASIYSQVRVPQAFVMKIRMTSKDLFGALNISPYQGASGQNSYRLVYKPENGMELQLVQGQNAQTIGSSSAFRLEDGKTHDILWTRDSYGRMAISVDNRKLIEAADSTLRGDFNGILLINSGGAYWIRSIEISGQ